MGWSKKNATLARSAGGAIMGGTHERDFEAATGDVRDGGRGRQSAPQSDRLGGADLEWRRA